MGFWSSIGSAISSINKSTENDEQDKMYKQHLSEIRNLKLDGDDLKKHKVNQKSGQTVKLPDEFHELQGIEDIESVKKHFHDNER